MPLICDLKTIPHTRVGVWQITEPAEFFMELLMLSETEAHRLSMLNGIRYLEWLAARYLLDHIMDHDRRIETATMPSGRPYLVGRKEEISLSHSDLCVAAMTGIVPVGVDIQKCREKILRIEPKFATTRESTQIDRTQAVRHLHVLWGAKEALYKIYGEGSIRFREHIQIDLPAHLDTTGVFTGTIHVRNTRIPCTLQYQFIHDYTLVYGCQIQ